MKRGISHATSAIRIVVVGDISVSEEGIVAILGRDKRYRLCGSAHSFYDATELIRRHRPDILLIEPFLGDRDGIRWIKDLAKEYPRTRILIVSRKSEEVYAERALHAGAAGYWMRTGSPEELLCAVEIVAKGGIYLSPTMAAVAIKRFARNNSKTLQGLDRLTDREITVLSLIATERGVGQIAKDLGISPKTVESHCEHIKLKLECRDAAALKRDARELLGSIGS